MKSCVWLNASLATLTAPHDFGVVRDGAIAVEAGRIAWIGTRPSLPEKWRKVEAIDAGGAWITPGLIDCHTHLVYAGNRADEFEARLEGASYADIAARGGGILATVRATRAASEDELVRQSRPRLKALAAQGATTVEIKSGYGLETASELKMLRAAQRLGEEEGRRVCATFLGAHTLPPEFGGRPDAYLDLLIDEMLPQLVCAHLASAVDAYHEHLAFDAAQVRRLFTAAQRLGLRVKLHADQLRDNGGAALAAEFGALSADHLEYSKDSGIAALASAGSVAVLLPGAFYFLQEKTPPPIAAMRKAGLPMAVASDCNPGTSPLVSLPLAMNLACVLFRLTPLEAWQGVTIHAARALGLADEVGSLALGKRADFALWDFESPSELVYALGGNACLGTAMGGAGLEQ